MAAFLGLYVKIGSGSKCIDVKFSEKVVNDL